MFFKYLNDIGITSAFFSPKRDEEYRRLNLEYLLRLKGASREETEGILIQGLQANEDLGKQLFFHELKGIREGVHQMAQEIDNLKDVFQQSHQILHDILESVQSPGAVKAAEYARQAARNISDALHMNDKRAGRLMGETVKLLKKAVKINDYDYKAHFDLGWLHDFYLNDLQGAEYHYDTAVLRSLRRDKNFAIFALRHLAEVRRVLGDKKGALEAAMEAAQLDDSKTCEVKYELALNLMANGLMGPALQELEKVVWKNSIYYHQISTDPAFAGIREVDDLLSRLFTVRIQESKKDIAQAWELFKGRCSFLRDDELKKLHGQIEKMVLSMEQFHYVELPVLAEMTGDKLQSLYKKCLMDEHKKLWKDRSVENAMLRSKEKPWEKVGKKIYDKRKMLVTFLLVILSASFLIALIIVSFSWTHEKPASRAGMEGGASSRESPRKPTSRVLPQNPQGLFDFGALNDTSYKLIQPGGNWKNEMNAFQSPRNSGGFLGWDKREDPETLDPVQIWPRSRVPENQIESMKKKYESDLQNLSSQDKERLREMYRNMR